jgi:3-deoxy-D-manno-octulosonic-acid transferase
LKLAAPPLPVDQRELSRLRHELAGRPVWVAASTHPNEETLIAAAHRVLAADHPGLLTIIAPRHPDRGAALAAALDAPRRGAGQPPPEEGIWIADTIGELGLWYRLAYSWGAVCCRRAAGKIRWSRRGWVVPSPWAPIAVTSPTQSPCCAAPAR